MQHNTAVISGPSRMPADGHVPAEAQAELQRWIARELHDLVVQPLTNTLVGLTVVDRSGPDLAAGHSEAINRELRAAIDGLRQLMSQLRGEPAGPQDLVSAVTRLVEDLRARTGLDASLRVSAGWPSHLSPETSRNLRRIIEEALRNVVSHSGASWVEVGLDHVSGGLRVSITDNGVLGPESTDPACDGMGTRGMRERAVVIGGVLTIDHARTGSTIAVMVEDSASEALASVPIPMSGRGAR